MSAAVQTTLALSEPLLRWLRADPAWAGLPRAQRARLVWQSRWGSINSGLARALAGQREAVALQDPVLIVGPWRSGTTVMHELLAAALGTATPRTWQCMNPCDFELMPRRRGSRSIARPMDGLAISDDSPQEDEFALLALGADSAYRAFWMPHRIGELRHTLDPQYWLDHPAWFDAWEAFLLGVLRSTPAATQPLLLKSPNHSWRLPSILRRFPQARVVWMARDPTMLWHSNRKMWRSMFAEHGLSAPDDAALDAFLIEAFEQAAAVLGELVAHHDRSRWTVVRQETLQADPVSATQDVLRSIASGVAPRAQAFDAAVARIRDGRVERYPLGAPTTARAAIDALHAAQEAALAG